MASEAATEANVIAGDGLLAPRVVGGREHLVAVFVNDGDDAAQMVGYPIIELRAVRIVCDGHHAVLQIDEAPGDTVGCHLLIVIEVEDILCIGHPPSLVVRAIDKVGSATVGGYLLHHPQLVI